MHYCLVMHIVFCVLIDGVVSCERFSSINLFSKRPHVAALILARGGSKGIKLKNIQKVGNETLLSRSLLQAKKVQFDSIWVSTDHDLIFLEANKLPKVNVHWRTKESATDFATSLFATQEFLKKHIEIDVVALIQCTSPFLKAKYLAKALGLIGGFDCVFSVTRCSKLLWTILSDNKLVPVNFDPINRPRRQDLQRQFMENGMFYFATRKMVLNGHFQSDRCAVVEIPDYENLEIDEPVDLLVANMLINLTL